LRRAEAPTRDLPDVYIQTQPLTARDDGLRLRVADAMLIFVVARTRLDRYEELRRQFQDQPDVRIVLDRREGDRRARGDTFTGRDRRRRVDRRLMDRNAFRKLGWSVADPDEPAE
jgi:hypothetical protein